MDIMSKYQYGVDILKDLDYKDQYDIYDTYCTNYNHNIRLYENDEEFLRVILEEHFNNKFEDFAHALTCGKYKSDDKCVAIDEYDNLTSYLDLKTAMEELFDPYLIAHTCDGTISAPIDYTESYEDYLSETLEGYRHNLGEKEFTKELSNYVETLKSNDDRLIFIENNYSNYLNNTLDDIYTK